VNRSRICRDLPGYLGLGQALSVLGLVAAIC
jgi:hypothetical protein